MNTAIVYISSDSYVMQTGTSIYSLFENNIHIKKMDTYVISTGISERNKKKLRDIAFRFQRKLDIIDEEKLIEKYEFGGGKVFRKLCSLDSSNGSRGCTIFL